MFPAAHASRRKIESLDPFYCMQREAPTAHPSRFASRTASHLPSCHFCQQSKQPLDDEKRSPLANVHTNRLGKPCETGRRCKGGRGWKDTLNWTNSPIWGICYRSCKGGRGWKDTLILTSTFLRVPLMPLQRWKRMEDTLILFIVPALALHAAQRKSLSNHRRGFHYADRG
jgi:hypothetical protein